ncbi:hypothetical protein SMSP2_01276 [Limihaloglobus sulfuriphilus]|uniref:Uncharacterized protein n=1 Tax=Limihaloglobus sulfuriphilus TaxID=1851148 RepID=A0A1Q2MDX9_9BACT|nr:hypothetical protein [Limihaloglobus sulfuriphilus]AQQ70913.1 hypothetical protein SMSP2_01276 [Limihaloglobus sulfuriphilus]
MEPVVYVVFTIVFIVLVAAIKKPVETVFHRGGAFSLVMSTAIAMLAIIGMSSKINDLPKNEPVLKTILLSYTALGILILVSIFLALAPRFFINPEQRERRRLKKVDREYPEKLKLRSLMSSRKDIRLTGENHERRTNR